MTLEELNLHFYAVEQLNNAKDRLHSMNTFLRAQSLDGMPQGSGDHRKVEQLSILIDQQKQEVARMERIVESSASSVEQFIRSISDNRTAQIFSLRFLAGYSWQQVAEIIGGHNTENSVKSPCYRYLQSDTE